MNVVSITQPLFLPSNASFMYLNATCSTTPAQLICIIVHIVLICVQCVMFRQDAITTP